MTITALPSPPLRSDPAATFASKADAFMLALPTFTNELNAMGTAYNLAVSTTSSSSVLIGTGDKTFTVGAGLGFIPGMSISVARTSAPGTSSMFGVVKTYSSTTLVVTVASVTGSGTFTDWSISLAAAAVGAGLGSNTFSGVQNFAQGSNIASAATINLTTATGNFINITGTTGISTVTLGNGMWRMVKFAGACLLTYSATTNKLNTGGVDYTTSAGDMVLYAAGDGIINGTIYPASGSAVIPPTVPVIAAGAISRSTNATGFNTTPAKIGFNTSEASNNLTVDTGNSRLTIDVDGTYEVIINAPASSSAGVATGTIYLYKNGSSIKSVTGGTTGAANYSVHGTLLATPTLVAGDYLETYFSMSTGSGTIYARAIMTAKKIY